MVSRDQLREIDPPLIPDGNWLKWKKGQTEDGKMTKTTKCDEVK